MSANARPRKDYRIAPSQPPSSSPNSGLIAELFDERGELIRRFDFGALGAPPMMARELALAFRGHLADKSPSVWAATFGSGIHHWLRFLSEREGWAGRIESLREVDRALVCEFIAWLDRPPHKVGTRYARWSAFKQLLAWLQRHRPELVHPELELPFNPFPRKNAAARPRQALSRAELDAVLAACARDIESSWATFREGREALAEVERTSIAAFGLNRLNLDHLGVLLAVLHDRFGGLVPLQRAFVGRRAGHSSLLHAIQRRGGTGIVSRYLHADPATLIPFMIAIAAQTFANPEALRHMRRGCMSEHLMLDGRVVVSWSKGRATRVQRRSFLRDRTLSVPNLIDRVLALTEVLVAHAPAAERDRLFLCGEVMATRRVVLIPDYLVSVHVRRFVKRHGLCGADGQPLKLSLAALRATGLTLAHEALGYDLIKTQALANHASPDTTRHYVERPAVRAAQQVGLARLQGRFVSWVRGDPEVVARELGVSIDAAVDIALGRNATASGFTCANPLAGIGPGQRPGRLCTAWLGCFTCPNAVIPFEAETLARLLQTRAALTESRAKVDAERWRVLYAPKLEILERDVLPRFPDELITEATHLVSGLAPPPPIE
ncbi:MAG: site-specific integrase [Candidatus Binataceae bacterium]|nr:site-specific integrase [Candidatus Binataceae bacterium]